MVQPSPFVNEPDNELAEQKSQQRPSPRKRRRFLAAVLILQLLLIFLVFPMLFIYFENDQARQKIEESKRADLLNEPHQDRSYINGLYWSLITPITIGSDDTWPQTRNSRVLIQISGVIKLLTVGVAAVLLRDLIIPHKIQDFLRIGHRRYRRSEDLEIWRRS